MAKFKNSTAGAIVRLGGVPAFAWIVLILLLTGCGQDPRIDVTARIESGHVVFDLTSGGMNGVLGFAVMVDADTVWEVGTSYEKGTKIVYGELPTGGNMEARQVFPPPGTAIADIRGKTVTVRVDYQYDAKFSASVGHFKKLVVIPSADPARGE